MKMEFLPKKKGIPRVIHVTTIGITAYRALLGQCRHFRLRGLEVGFVFSPSPEAEKLRRMEYPVQEIAIDRSIKPWSDIRSILKMNRYFREVKPDIVHTHTSKAGVVGRIAARMAGVPNVMHTVHGFPFHPGMPKAKYQLYRQIEKWMAGLTDVIFSQSEEDVRYALQAGIKPRRNDLIHIGNGVNLTEFDPCKYHPNQRLRVREKLGINRTDPVITLIGRINKEKGYDDLVEALETLKEMPWRALLVGPDEGFLTTLKNRIDFWGLQKRIKILGFRNDITDLLLASDIYVLPSYREGLPRSLIEAQAMTLPCVASDIRGCREILEDGVTGFLIKPGDRAALSAALRRLLGEPQLRLAMGLAGRRLMLRCFDEAEVARKVMSVYEEVLEDEKSTHNNQQF